ncbi:50S ribosomal protein L9 [Candidatus Nomurabacteria bacterium]|nr:50S ribosomal protein L9 [Candidatus Nomurabacteria bacterium]
MKVILLNNIKKIGSRFDVIDVADGFAQNFLIPQKKALPATPEYLGNIENIKAEQASVIAAEKETVEAVIKALGDVTLEYSALANEQGGLYEAVSTALIAELLKEQASLELDEVYINLVAPIKTIGEYDIECAYGDTTGSFKLAVVAEAEEK